LFSSWQEYRAERAMAALQKLLPHQVKVLRDGKVWQAPAEELVPGDVIYLDDGDDVPADGRLLEAFGVRVNNATVLEATAAMAASSSCDAAVAHNQGSEHGEASADQLQHLSRDLALAFPPLQVG
jgi:magnesium-transporting ATPase (P-type)